MCDPWICNHATDGYEEGGVNSRRVFRVPADFEIDLLTEEKPIFKLIMSIVNIIYCVERELI